MAHALNRKEVQMLQDAMRGPRAQGKTVDLLPALENLCKYIAAFGLIGSDTPVFRAALVALDKARAK